MRALRTRPRIRAGTTIEAPLNVSTEDSVAFPWLRNTKWWLVAAAVLFSAAVIPLGFGVWQIHSWEEHAFRTRYSEPPAARPDTELLGWAGLALGVVALGCLLVGLASVVCGRHRRRTKLVASVAILGVLLTGLWLAVLVDRSTDPPRPPAIRHSTSIAALTARPLHPSPGPRC